MKEKSFPLFFLLMKKEEVEEEEKEDEEGGEGAESEFLHDFLLQDYFVYCMHICTFNARMKFVFACFAFFFHLHRRTLLGYER